MTVLFWPTRSVPGWLAVWWEPDRSAPYDVKWAPTRAEAMLRLGPSGLLAPP